MNLVSPAVTESPCEADVEPALVKTGEGEVIGGDVCAAAYPGRAIRQTSRIKMRCTV